MENITTTDLVEFGAREIEIAKDLLTAWVNNGLPDDFEEEKVTIMFNKNSGYVFLTNEEFQVAMLVNKDLRSFYNCSNCGAEGLEDEGFYNDDKSLCDECHEKEKQEMLKNKVPNNLGIDVYKIDLNK